MSISSLKLKLAALKVTGRDLVRNGVTIPYANLSKAAQHARDEMAIRAAIGYGTLPAGIAASIGAMFVVPPKYAFWTATVGVFATIWCAAPQLQASVNEGKKLDSILGTTPQEPAEARAASSTGPNFGFG
jgi:hypothetical protein